MTVKTRVIKIFRAGRHTAMDGRAFDYPVQALEFCCSAYNALNTPTPRAPLVLGHPEVNWPTYGTVKRLSVLDGAMYAEAEMSPELVQLVAHGHYKNVSASFDGVTHKLGGAVEFMALRHVGFLGAMPPAIKGLGPVTVDGNHGRVLTYGEEVDALPMDFAEERDTPPPAVDWAPGPMSDEGAASHRLAVEYQRAIPSLSYWGAMAVAHRPSSTFTSRY